MVANNTTVVANSAITAHGGIGLSLEMTKDAQPSAGTGVIYMKDGGGLYWRSNEMTEVSLSTAGASTSSENIFTVQQTFNDMFESKTACHSGGYESYSRPNNVFNPGSSNEANCALFIAMF